MLVRKTKNKLHRVQLHFNTLCTIILYNSASFILVTLSTYFQPWYARWSVKSSTSVRSTCTFMPARLVDAGAPSALAFLAGMLSSRPLQGRSLCCYTDRVEGSSPCINNYAACTLKYMLHNCIICTDKARCYTALYACRLQLNICSWKRKFDAVGLARYQQ